MVSLKRKIAALQNSIGSCSELEDGENEGASNPELDKLLTENSKLKYQVATLKRVRLFYTQLLTNIIPTNYNNLPIWFYRLYTAVHISGRKCRKIFLEVIFPISENFFSKFSYKIFAIVLLDIIGLENFQLSFSDFCLYINFQSIKEEKANSKRIMTNCQFTLNELFRKAIALTFPDLPDAPVIVQASQGDKFGDYQCNSAMAINQVRQHL